jgi:hypothetical protein
VDGVSVGQPTAYTFTDIVANRTIAANQATAGTYYTLTGNWSGAGYLVSTPAGINVASKSARFLSGTSVVIAAGTGSAVQPGTWSGACAGSGATCTVTMTSDKNFTAYLTEVSAGPVQVVGKGYYQTCEDAFAAAANGDVINIVKTHSQANCETNGTTDILVTVKGGWDGMDFTTRTTTTTSRNLSLSGALIIEKVGIIADVLVL